MIPNHTWGVMIACLLMLLLDMPEFRSDEVDGTLLLLYLAAMNEWL